MKAGGGRLVSISRWQQAAKGTGAATGVDLVVCSSAAASDQAVAALVAGGALASVPQYVVEWIAKPRASLAKHVLLRRLVGYWGRDRGWVGVAGLGPPT